MSNQKKTNKKLQIDEGQREKEELLEMKKLDTTPLKEEIYQLREQLSYLIHQKSTVEGEMVRAGQKYMKDSFEIEKTIKIQEEELTDLQNNYKLLKNTFQETRKKSKADWQVQMEANARRRKEEKEGVNRRIAELQKKVDYLKQFRGRESEYLTTLARLMEKQKLSQFQQKKDIEKIVAEHEGLRRQLKENVEKEIENIQQSQVSKLEQQMNREQQIKRENELIMEQINLCESEKIVLQEEYKQLMQQNQNSKLQNPNSLLQGQATETYERSLRVIKLENKLAKLKTFLQEQIQRLDNEAKSVEQSFQTSVSQIDGKVAKSQSWLKLKQKDLKKMKACAQMVLNQRSNLQAYLLQVFHEHGDLDYKDPANVNQILRFLFIKINSKKPPVSYKDYLLSSDRSQLSNKQL